MLGCDPSAIPESGGKGKGKGKGKPARAAPASDTPPHNSSVQGNAAAVELQKLKAKQLFCSEWLKGKCTKGANCTLAHVAAEVGGELKRAAQAFKASQAEKAKASV